MRGAREEVLHRISAVHGVPIERAGDISRPEVDGCARKGGFMPALEEVSAAGAADPAPLQQVFVERDQLFVADEGEFFAAWRWSPVRSFGPAVFSIAHCAFIVLQM